MFDSSIPEESLGLMHRVEEVYPGRGRSVSCNFLHLTLQEYLAAYYCSLHDTGTLQEVLFQHSSNWLANPRVSFHLPNSFQAFFSNYEMGLGGYYHWPVLLFTVGLADPSALLEILPILRGLLVSTMHLLYETQSPELARKILSSYQWSPNGEAEGLEPLDISPKSPLDFFVTRYCIPHSNRLWNVRTSTDPDTNFEHFSKGLNMSSGQGNSGRIEKLEVNVSKVAMLHLLYTHTLAELTIYAL